MIAMGWGEWGVTDIGHGVSFLNEVLELESGDSCKASHMCIMPLNCTL